MNQHSRGITKASRRRRPAAPLRSQVWLYRLRRFLVWIPLGVLVMWTLIPLIVSISVSLKTLTDAFSDPSLIPEEPTLDAYRRAIGRPTFLPAVWTSVLVAVGTCALTATLAVPCAYAFARFRFRGRHLLLLFTLLPRLAPSLGLMLPLYLIAARLGALDSRLTLIVVYSGMLLPLAVWLLVGFFQQIPREIEEAANVDGATLWSRLRYIVLPLSWPAILTIFVLGFREAWNEFDLVLVLTSTPAKRTLPYDLFLLRDSGGIVDFPIENAFAVITILPIILIYMRIEKYVVQGVISGSVK